MKLLSKIWFVCTAVALSGSFATAAFTVGSPAPPLANGGYVQGEPVKQFESGKVYLVEFWATWCGACIDNIPHLNELQRKYADKGLVVIGQNVSEEDTSKVAPFVKKMGDKMTYRVALDDTKDLPRGKMVQHWLLDSGASGGALPFAFLIGKDQKVVWMGLPLALDEKTIESVLDGTYDAAAAAEKHQKMFGQREKKSALIASARKNISDKNWDAANRDIEELTPLLAGTQPSMIDLLHLQLNCGRGDFATATALLKKLAAGQNDTPFLQGCSMLMQAAKNDLSTMEETDKILNETSSRIDAEESNIMILIARAQSKKALGQNAEAIALANKAISKAPEASRKGVKGILKDILPEGGS